MSRLYQCASINAVVGGATSELDVDARPVHLLSGAGPFITLSLWPLSPGRRFVAALLAWSRRARVLAMLPTPQQSDDARSTERASAARSLDQVLWRTQNLRSRSLLRRPLFLMRLVLRLTARDATAPTGTKIRHLSGPAHRRTVTRTRRGSLIAEKVPSYGRYGGYSWGCYF